MSVDAMMDERYGKVGTPEREDVMEEIKIYHSLWRMLLMGIGGLAFAVMIILILRSLRPGNVIIGYAGIVFFGLGGLALIFWALKEKLSGRPFLTITDEVMIYNGGWKQYEIRFADVNSFVLQDLRTFFDVT